MSQVTLSGADVQTPVPNFKNAIAGGDASERDNYKPARDEEAPAATPEEIEERIAKAKEAAKFSHNRTLEKESAVNKDRFKLASGRTTYYYENISQYELAWTHPDKVIPSTPTGGVIDFSEYFDKEEEIINYKAIRKNEFPHNIKPLIRRLTPEQFLNKVEKQRQVEAQKHQYHAEARGKNKGSEEDKVSSTVKYKLQEYLTWEARSKEEKAKSSYSKYDFIQWVSSWTFNEPEFREMLYQIRDAEIIKTIAERKQELMSM